MQNVWLGLIINFDFDSGPPLKGSSTSSRASTTQRHWADVHTRAWCENRNYQVADIILKLVFANYHFFQAIWERWLEDDGPSVGVECEQVQPLLLSSMPPSSESLSSSINLSGYPSLLKVQQQELDGNPRGAWGRGRGVHFGLFSNFYKILLHLWMPGAAKREDVHQAGPGRLPLAQLRRGRLDGREVWSRTESPRAGVWRECLPVRWHPDGVDGGRPGEALQHHQYDNVCCALTKIYCAGQLQAEFPCGHVVHQPRWGGGHPRLERDRGWVGDHQPRAVAQVPHHLGCQQGQGEDDRLHGVTAPPDPDPWVQGRRDYRLVLGGSRRTFTTFHQL